MRLKRRRRPPEPSRSGRGAADPASWAAARIGAAPATWIAVSVVPG